MSELQIKRITTKRELKDFVRFNYEMYKDCPYAVPDFLEDTLDTFNKDYNAAFEFCDADWFLAYRDGKIVGRVAAIINNRANQKWGTRNVRFGWIDFVDDLEVCKALISTVEQWGKERGMDTIVGPLGFTDLDRRVCFSRVMTRWGRCIRCITIPTTTITSRHWGLKRMPCGWTGE